jgi:hypothetical protein
MDAKRSGVLFRKTMCRKILYTSRILGIGCAPCTRAILKMRILEPEDGGGTSHKECVDYIKNKLLVQS